jgi:hypothetical protein
MGQLIYGSRIKIIGVFLGKFTPILRVTVATKRLNGFFREIELLENRIFDLLYTIYFNYPTFNVSHVLRSTKNASKD